MGRVCADTVCTGKMQMSSVAVSLSRKKSSKTTNRVVEENNDGNDENILQDLTAELPPKENWEVELFLDTLILG